MYAVIEVQGEYRPDGYQAGMLYNGEYADGDVYILFYYKDYITAQNKCIEYSEEYSHAFYVEPLSEGE